MNKMNCKWLTVKGRCNYGVDRWYNQKSSHPKFHIHFFIDNFNVSLSSFLFFRSRGKISFVLSAGTCLLMQGFLWESKRWIIAIGSQRFLEKTRLFDSRTATFWRIYSRKVKSSMDRWPSFSNSRQRRKVTMTMTRLVSLFPFLSARWCLNDTLVSILSWWSNFGSCCTLQSRLETRAGTR